MKHTRTLGEVLIETGLIDADGYARALEVQARDGGSLSRIVADLGLAEEEGACQSVASALGIEYATLGPETLPADLPTSLAAEWIGGVVAACWASPKTWAGLSSNVHLHVWAAVLLGGAIVTLPIFLAVRHPGKPLTRHVVGASQMLFGALLIHLTGGPRSELLIPPPA